MKSKHYTLHGMDALVRWALTAALAAAASAVAGDSALPLLRARPFEICEPAPSCEQIGRVRLLGAVALPTLTANDQRLVGLSGLAWDDDEGVLYAVSDMGALFGLKPAFRSGRLVDAQLSSAVPLLDSQTGKPVRWQRSDSEGMDIINGRNGVRGDAELIISFEGEPRVARYRLDGSFIAEIELPLALRGKQTYRYNKMLEAVCLHPREGVLTAPETPILKEKNPFLYRVRDGHAWQLPATRSGITALECLPDSSVLLLERDLTLMTLRWRITLRKLTLTAGTTADSETLAELDSSRGLNIDNFEGLAHHRGQRFFMVSDNNDNLLQQTVLVYFEILGKP